MSFRFQRITSWRITSLVHYGPWESILVSKSWEKVWRIFKNNVTEVQSVLSIEKARFHTEIRVFQRQADGVRREEETVREEEEREETQQTRNESVLQWKRQTRRGLSALPPNTRGRFTMDRSSLNVRVSLLLKSPFKTQRRSPSLLFSCSLFFTFC